MQFDIGYAVDAPLPTVAAHYDHDAGEQVVDGPLEHRFSGVMLLLVGVIVQFDREFGDYTIPCM